MSPHKIEIPQEIDMANFISHHAHDLRSPYNRIMGFSKIMLKGQSGPLTDFQKEDLSTVYNGSVHAFTMVNNLIEIARYIGGEKQIKHSQVSVEGVITQAISQWEKYHPGQAVDITTKIDKAPTAILADENQLAQALNSILTCVIEFVQAPSEASLLASVSKDGTIIFTAQSHGTLSRNPSSADVDMYGFIAQSIVKLHGGEFTKQEVGDDSAVMAFAIPLSAD